MKSVEKSAEPGCGTELEFFAVLFTEIDQIDVGDDMSRGEHDDLRVLVMIGPVCSRSSAASPPPRVNDKGGKEGGPLRRPSVTFVPCDRRHRAGRTTRTRRRSPGRPASATRRSGPPRPPAPTANCSARS